jgi:hypothetical protein
MADQFLAEVEEEPADGYMRISGLLIITADTWKQKVI